MDSLRNRLCTLITTLDRTYNSCTVSSLIYILITIVLGSFEASLGTTDKMFQDQEACVFLAVHFDKVFNLAHSSLKWYWQVECNGTTLGRVDLPSNVLSFFLWTFIKEAFAPYYTSRVHVPLHHRLRNKTFRNFFSFVSLPSIAAKLMKAHMFVLTLELDS